MGRLKIYFEVLRSTRQWLFVGPLALLGVVQSIRDEFLPSAVAEAFKLPIFLPNWSWLQWTLLVLLLVVLLTLEGAYQAVKRRDVEVTALTARLDRRSALEALVAKIADYQQAGGVLYARKVGSDAELDEWKAEVMQWRQGLGETITIGVNLAAAQSVDMVATVGAAYTGGAFNDDHNTQRLYLHERMKRLGAFSSQLQADLRGA